MMKMSSWTCLLLALVTQVAWAELPVIRFDVISPLGTSPDRTIEVEILGNDLEGLQTIHFPAPGFRVEPVKEKKFNLTVAADVPAGTYDCYLVGRFGVSNARLFAVSAPGLTEVADNGENLSAAKAQRVAVNSAINGTMNGAADEFYSVELKMGQRITADFQAWRLESDLDGTMAVLDAGGRQLASSGDYYGRDPFLDFLAPADGVYTFAVHDLSYRGGGRYRLIISNRPHVETVFPAVVQAGVPSTLTAFGTNLGGSPSALAVGPGDLPLEQRSFSVTSNPEVTALRTYRFESHPSHHSVLPTAATCTLVGQQVAPEGLRDTWNAQPIFVSDTPVKLEQEPNDNRDQAQLLELPAVVAGRFDKPRDADWYQFKTSEAGNYFCDVYCERIAGRADPFALFIDEQGNRVNELDDYGHRLNAFDGHLRDPAGNPVGLQKEKTYRVLVQDRYGHGGQRYHYVLHLRRPQPDFYIASVERGNDPMATTLYKGTATWLDLVVHQADEFTNEVVVTAENLPPGVHFQQTSVFNNTYGAFVLWADENAADYTGPIRLMAEGKRTTGETLRREVRPYRRVFGISGTQIQRQQMLAVREMGPYSLALEPSTVTVESGKPVSVKVKLKRIWPDFKEAVNIQPKQWSGNFSLGNFTIPANETEKTVEIAVQAGTRPGNYTLCVIGQGQVPFHKNAESKERPNTLVTTPSTPITITVTAPPVK